MRQEGIGVPMKQRASPRSRVHALRDTSDREEEEDGSDSIQSGGSQDFNGYSKSREESHPPTSIPSQTAPLPNSQTEGRFDTTILWNRNNNIMFLIDIREVLKDLQMLSVSLLGMETSQVTVTDPQSKT